LSYLYWQEEAMRRCIIAAVIAVLVLIAFPFTAFADLEKVDLNWEMDPQPITNYYYVRPYPCQFPPSYFDFIVFDYTPPLISGTDNVFPNGKFLPEITGYTVFWGFRGTIVVNRKERLFGSILNGGNGLYFGVNDNIFVRVNDHVLDWAEVVNFRVYGYEIPDSVWQDGENTIEVIYWNYTTHGQVGLGALYLWVPSDPVEMTASLVDFVDGLSTDPADGEMTGKNSRANAGRAGALMNRLLSAISCIEAGDIDAALEELESARSKADGVYKDWLIGDAALEFCASIDEIVARLEGQ
jgi:hypothetical protein